MLRSAIVGKGMLKALHFFTENKRSLLGDAIERGADFVADLRILGSQVKIRNFVHAWFLSNVTAPGIFQCTLRCPRHSDFPERDRQPGSFCQFEGTSETPGFESRSNPRRRPGRHVEQLSRE